MIEMATPSTEYLLLTRVAKRQSVEGKRGSLSSRRHSRLRRPPGDGKLGWACLE